MSVIAQAQFTISDLSDAAVEIVVGTQTAVTASWTGKASFSELKHGQQIIYWLPYGGASNTTLNLTLADGSTTGPIPCYYGGTSRIGTHYAAGNVIRLVYLVDTPIGTSKYTGWWADANYNTNNYDRVNYKASVKAAGPISAGRVGVFNDDGKLIMLSTAPFNVTKPILYIGTAYTASALTQTNNYISWGTSFSLANTVSGFSGTAGETVYIKGTLNGNMFTPAAGVLTTTTPTAEDGYTYILLGLMSTTVNAVLAPEHPMFRYYNGGFKAISQIACEAFLEADEAKEAIENLEIGGRNYVLDSGKEISSGALQIASYKLSEPMTSGLEYTLSVCFTPDSGLNKLRLYTSSGRQLLAEITLSGTAKQTKTVTFTASYASGYAPSNAPDNADIQLKRPTAAASGAETVIHWIMLERGNRAGDYLPAPEDAEESLELKLASVHAQINNEGDRIRQEIQATYALASDMSQVMEQVGTIAEQTERNYTWSVSRISQLQQDVAQAKEATEEQLNIIRTYMSFGEDGLVIGKNGNPFTFRVVNDRLAFYMSDTEVAYLSNNKLYVTQAEMLSRLVIGKFAFEPQANGNLSLIYIG